MIHGFAPLNLEEFKVDRRGSKKKKNNLSEKKKKKKKNNSQNKMTFPKTLGFVKCVLTTGTFQLTEVLSPAVAAGCRRCL